MNNPFLTQQLQKLSIGLVSAGKAVLVENDKVASGRTLRSMEGDIAQRGDEIHIDLLAAEHIQFTLFGRSPGKAPPMGVIEAWLQDRRLDLSASKIRENIKEFGTRAEDFGFYEQLEAKVLPLIDNTINSDAFVESIFEPFLRSTRQ